MLEELKRELKKDREKQVACFAKWEGDWITHETGNDLYRPSARVKQAFQLDIIPKNFKPYLWISDPTDIGHCLDKLQENFESLKNLYLYLSSIRGSALSSEE